MTNKVSKAAAGTFALFISLSVCSSPVRSQAVDSGTVDQGAIAGALAANKHDVSMRGVAAFAAALPIGFFLPVLVAGNRSIGATGVIAGVGGITGAALLGDVSLPAPVQASINGRGDAFRKAFLKSYGDRVVYRRKSAAIVGGVFGTFTGVGLLYYLLLHIVGD